MMMKHNKKRNAGLLYEFLTRYAAVGLVENDQKKVTRSIKILKKFFREGTELHREFRLYRALMNASVTSKQTAERIIEASRAGARSFDVKKLDHEKSLLIRSINHTFNDPSFYDQHIDEYKLYATVHVLLNEWRMDVPNDVVRTALFEEELVEHLMAPKPKNILDEGRDDVDDLVVRLMMKRVDNKYQGLLNGEQLQLMNTFVGSMQSGDHSRAKSLIESLRGEVLTMIDNIVARPDCDAGLSKRLSEVRSLLEEPVDAVDDRVLARYLRIARLKQEILGV
jgi:hypothetical protein